MAVRACALISCALLQAWTSSLLTWHSLTNHVSLSLLELAAVHAASRLSGLQLHLVQAVAAAEAGSGAAAAAVGCSTIAWTGSTALQMFEAGRAGSSWSVEPRSGCRTAPTWDSAVAASTGRRARVLCASASAGSLRISSTAAASRRGPTADIPAEVRSLDLFFSSQRNLSQRTRHL